ncbi:MAG: hypothetical protein HY716_08525 [Planctomycetes bacterium]|nr:hypothetical protein [Planctomycetota bacterium]
MRDRFAWILAGASGLAVIAELLFVRSHHAPSLYAVLGFASCVAVVLLTKAAGRAFLQKPEEGDDD